MRAGSRRAGVRVTQVGYGGTIHDFMLLNSITTARAPRAAIAQAADFLATGLTS
jgi:acetyl esterase